MLGPGSAVSAQVGGGPANEPLTSGLLSPVGERAIDDLRRCLTQSDTLNVFYLIDNSGSLAQYTDPPMVGTDPDFKRVDVINQSLRSLTELTEGPSGKNVNFSMGFFGNGYSPAISWSVLNRSNLSGLENEVDTQIRVVQPPGGFTHWEAGILEAQRALQQKNVDNAACQMLVWLTDGGINVGGAVTPTEQSAVNLCGNDFGGFGLSPDNTNGVLNSLRQGGVSVFAVFLNAESERDRGTWTGPLMRPLAEGTGNILGTEVSCGIVPIPDSYAAGAFIEADSIQALGNQFLRLSAIISGGRDGVTIDKDGIAISPGITRVQVIGIDAQAVLTTPTGRAITPGSADATFIDAAVESREEIGTWKVTSQTWNAPALVWGALRLDPSGVSEISGGAEQDIPFILDTGGNPVARVSDYGFTLGITAIYPDGERQSFSLPSTQLSEGQNFFSFVPDARYGDVVVRFQTEGLRTIEGGIALSEVVAEVKLMIAPPTQFPTISAPQITQALMGSITPAQGLLTIVGPEDGNDGEVCIPGLGTGGFSTPPTIQDDSADRFANWQWALSPAANARVVGDCIQVAGNETTTIAFSATHPESADSVVRALAQMTLRDNQGTTLDVTREIIFPSERIFFSGVANTLRILLLIIGIALPFVLLYFVTLLFTKIDHGRELRRATMPVVYRMSDNKILNYAGDPLGPQDLPSDAFKFLKPRDDARELQDDVLGKLRTVVSINPLRPPWFEVVAKLNTVVFTGKSPDALLKKRFQTGEKALFGGQMSKLWALSFSEAALMNATAKDAELPGTLVVYSRNQGTFGGGTADVVTSVVQDAKISGALTEAREAREALGKKLGKNSAGKTSGNETSGTELPPRPGRSGGFSGSGASSGSGGLPPKPPGKSNLPPRPQR